LLVEDSEIHIYVCEAYAEVEKCVELEVDENGCDVTIVTGLQTSN
jgi:uncharacterized protein YuzE